MSGYDKPDAAKDTDVGTREVSRAWHEAREDARRDGELTDRPAADSGNSSNEKTNDSDKN